MKSEDGRGVKISLMIDMFFYFRKIIKVRVYPKNNIKRATYLKTQAGKIAGL
jgi:hypothetical protein